MSLVEGFRRNLAISRSLPSGTFKEEPALSWRAEMIEGATPSPKSLVLTLDTSLDASFTTEVEMAEGTNTVNILVFSDDATTRQEILTAVGRKAAKDLPEIEWTQAATADAVFDYLNQRNYALLILDAEAPKLGGMGLGKMIHDEVDPEIPFICVVGRPQDEWLSRWAGAAAIISQPVNPRELSESVAKILKTRI